LNEAAPVEMNAVARAAGPFNVADLQRECPGVSVDMIRHVLKRLREKGQVKCLGRGRNAIWKKT
jgi:predicted transcriptional regulator of viral defense system